MNLDGSVGTTTNSTATVWSYPAANDPNNAAFDTTPEPQPPLGAFLRATPAMGFVQFPSTIAGYTPTLWGGLFPCSTSPRVASTILLCTR